MYAVIEVQGMQYRVAKGDRISVNRMEPVEEKKLKVVSVLFAKDKDKYIAGDPYIKGAYVECEVIGDKRGRKVIAFKFRERKSSQSTRGHRQDLTELVIKDIKLG
ncbi:MAG: 50S ribosomal protein L21 [Candidatus Omnitrophica bacterium]|nr:50S ribosomal protein L21 [Candidatus Omnitrophota bacterium]